MEDSKLNNCYTRFEEIKGESIQEKLDQTIKSSKKEAETKVSDFINTFKYEPTEVEKSKRNEDLREKKILKKIIESKNWLLNNLNSEYINISSLYAQDVPKMAEHITWYWLSLPSLKFEILNLNKFDDLKKALTLINYHLFIYKLSDVFCANNEMEGETINWPKSDNVEFFYIESLEQKLNNLKASNERIFELLSDRGIKQRKELSLVEAELSRKTTEFNSTNLKLQSLNSDYFFHQDNLFTNYVFGDILPELKQVYSLLKEYKIYENNWGYFAHCLTLHNYSASHPFLLKLSLRGNDFDTKDLGYVLNLLQNKFFKPSKTDYLKWLQKIVVIESSRGNNQDISTFYNKSVRPYKKGNSEPAFYHQISEKLHFFLIK